ncbi:MAG TPA: alkaline phosphatase family protein [Thermoanaerobaculia bacterium]|nr:alkaline phosphatase family protein [Thermoanaerobaculia bacterium]
MRLRALRDACLGGFLYGALLYGAVLSLVHVVHNHLGSARDALIAYVGFLVLYGLWGAAFFALASLAAIPFSRPETQERRGLWLGLLAFNLFFWEVFFLYGLTYDQAPLHPTGKWGMAGVLALLAVPIAVGVVLGSWLLFRLFAALRYEGMGLAAIALFVIGIAVHAAAPLYAGGGEPPVKPRAGAPAIPVEDTGLKVIFVGFDGADWRVARPMMARGELPTFSRIVRQGTSGPLESIHDSNSAVIWASIYTGMTPGRHGVLDFYRIAFPGMASKGLYPVHRTYFKELSDLVAPLGLASQIPVDRFSLAAPPFWEVADRAGLSTGVVDGYFYSFPAPRPSKPESWFLSYGLDEMAERPSPQVPLFAQPVSLFREMRPFLKDGDFKWQSAALLKLLAERPQPKFVNFYTHQPDSDQHWFWKWYEPERFFGVKAKDVAAKGGIIPGIYRGFDGFLSRLLAQAGPDTVVIIASDHGHSPTIVHSLYTQHRHGPPGILLMRGGPVRRGLDLQGASVFDLYPTVLYLLGLPVPQDAAGKVLTGALDPGFVRLHPVRTVPTYRDLGLSPNLPGASRDGSMNREEIEKLKSLGYIF